MEQDEGQGREAAGAVGDPALGANHRLLHRLGEGASGEVWEAVDRRTGQHVAAKLLRPELADDHAVVSGFVAERSVLVGLRHPSIVTVRDLVAEQGRLAILMDLVDGGSLRDLLDARGTLPPAVAAGVVAQVLDALAHAQQAGVQHRDVKPDNVLLTTTWEALRPGGVKLADFGVARLVGRDAASPTGLLGTPEYMAPELVETGRSGHPADVYAAGIVLYELLAGRTPFAGPGGDVTVAHRQVGLEPPRLEVPEVLWRLVQRMVAKDPGARPGAAPAAAQLRAMAPRLAGAPALAPQAPVADFERSERPATVLWGQAGPASTPPGHGTLRPASGGADGAGVRRAPAPLPDLGPAHGATILRPVAPAAAPGAPTAVVAGRPWWRRRVTWLVLGGVLLTVAAVAVALVWPWGATRPTQPDRAPEQLVVTQEDEPLPTGLGTSRSATYDATARRVRLTITWTAQKTALAGPLLEVLPGSGGDCPAAAWDGAPVRRNLPTATGIAVECGWAVDTTVPAGGSRSVTVEVPAELADERSAVQGWLDEQARATQEALADDQVTSSAYPVQRLQAIQVRTPSGVLTGRPVPVTLVPVWPSGPDPVEPLFTSPGAGAPTTTLHAVAGGTGAVRLSDGCGSLTVSPDGLRVTALTMTPQCTVRASVGNFTDLESSPFQVATRGR